MDERAGIRGVVVAHGPMANAMVDAVRRIAGSAADALVPLSNDGKSPAELKADLDALLGDHTAIVFTDLLAGSCGMVALSSCRERARRAVLTGVNLPMLLDFVFHTELPLADAVARIREKGREAITHPQPRG